MVGTGELSKSAREPASTWCKSPWNRPAVPYFLLSSSQPCPYSGKAPPGRLNETAFVHRILCAVTVVNFNYAGSFMPLF